MKDEYQFPEFDTSYWKVKDKEWMSERAKNWIEIERMIKLHKPAKGRSIAKQYYMKGKLPDWEKLRDWNSDMRHVDLFLFLWLHPSKDKEFLIKLRDQYIQSKVVTRHDIGHGFGIFFRDAIAMASQDYSDDQIAEGRIDHVVVTGANEFYFDVLMQDIDYLNQGVELLGLPGNPPKMSDIRAPKTSFQGLNTMSKWLCIKNMRPINEDMVLQYERPLEWWYNCLERNEDFFSSYAQTENLRNAFRKVLYRIHHFDTEAEGDTCRTRFAHRIRKILDERSFIGEIEEMWVGVNSGDIQVENAFQPLGY